MKNCVEINKRRLRLCRLRHTTFALFQAIFQSGTAIVSGRLLWLLSWRDKKVIIETIGDEQTAPFASATTLNSYLPHSLPFLKDQKRKQKSLSLTMLLLQRLFLASHAIQAVPASWQFESCEALPCRKLPDCLPRSP